MWPAVPASDYYGPSAPPPGYQQTACLSAATLEWAAVRGPGGGSHVHHRPVDGGGVQLFPCSIATTTPQAFTVASRKGLPHPARESPVASVPRACALPGPPSTRLGPVVRLRGFHRWFLHSYTFPSRLPDPARLVVPDRPGVVRAAPARPRASGVRLLSASAGRCDGPQVGPFIPPGRVAPRGARGSRTRPPQDRAP